MEENNRSELYKTVMMIILDMSIIAKNVCKHILTIILFW